MDVFLDFDDTITYIEPEPYYDEEHELWVYQQKLKDNVNEFLRYLTNNFNVYWCSCNSEENIKSRLKDVVEPDVLSKIPYYNFYKYGKFNKVKGINAISSKYIFIDDSKIEEEQVLIPKDCYYIQANESDKEDLKKIMAEIQSLQELKIQ